MNQSQTPINSANTDKSDNASATKEQLEVIKLQQEIEKGFWEIVNLKSENSKIESEKEKTIIETEKLKRNWFVRDLTLETIGKIILGAGVMAFSYGLFIQPYFAGREETLKEKNEKNKDEREKLETLNIDLNKEKAKLKDSNALLDNKARALADGLREKEFEKQILDKSLADGRKALEDFEKIIQSRTNQYLSLADSIKKSKNQIEQLQRNILMVTVLQRAFENSKRCLRDLPILTKLNIDFINKINPSGNLFNQKYLDEYPDSTSISNALKDDLNECLTDLRIAFTQLNIPQNKLDSIVFKLTHQYSLTQLGITVKSYQIMFNSFNSSKFFLGYRNCKIAVTFENKVIEIRLYDNVSNKNGIVFESHYTIKFAGNVIALIIPLLDEVQKHTMKSLTSLKE